MVHCCRGVRKGSTSGFRNQGKSGRCRKGGEKQDLVSEKRRDARIIKVERRQRRENYKLDLTTLIDQEKNQGKKGRPARIKNFGN